MYELNGELCSSVKTVNENAGFTTPFENSSLTSRKIGFPAKTKIAFGDLKNMTTSHKPTHSKKIQLSKVKVDDFVVELAPKSDNLIEWDEIANQIVEEDLMEAWNDKLILTDKQFELLFLKPNENTAPATPPTTPIDLDYSSYLEISSHECNFDVKNDDNDELPSLNLSYIDGSWNEKSTNENDQNISNLC